MMAQDRLTLLSGVVIIELPTEMTPEDYHDFKEWLEIIRRKAGRCVAAQDAPVEGTKAP